MHIAHKPSVTVAKLGAAQTLAWASSFYLPAMLATAMAADLGVTRPTVFAVFSAALLVSAFLGPAVGRWIDQHGGRPVLMTSSLLFVLGLCTLGTAQGFVGLVLAWAVLGLAMGAGLYDAGFATLVRLHGTDARRLITGITLIAGFASTVGWPLTTLMQAQWGWRGACFGWAVLHVLVGLPLNAWLPRLPTAPPTPAVAARPVPEAHAPKAPPLSTTLLLAFLFALMSFVGSAMASHLPDLLQAHGASLALAVLAGSLLGPAQVAARVVEFTALRRVSPLVSARVAALTHPLGAGLLLMLGVPLTLPFVLLHGAGNGLLTIVRGTLPLALFGAQGYGARQGWIVLPGRLAGALSPWLFGLVLERWGAASLWLSMGLGIAAFGCLMRLRVPGQD
jgi:predicted MFS family arabinose efflux permease